jgi:hypothetical protein
MKSINQKELEIYTTAELRQLLKAIEEMLFIPIQNSYKLSNKDLRQMKKDVENRIDELNSKVGSRDMYTIQKEIDELREKDRIITNKVRASYSINEKS